MILADKDGVYHWVYEFHLMKNPVIFFTIAKIFLGIIAVGIIFMLCIDIPDIVRGYMDVEDIANFFKGVFLFSLAFLAIAFVGYVIYAAMQGWKYCVLFTMDEEGIEHKQLPVGYEKATVVSDLNVLLGLVAGNPTMAGIGLTSRRDSIRSNFKYVRSIQGIPSLCTIKVNEVLDKNQVYVDQEDYDFVYDYIVRRCPNARVRSLQAKRF